MKLQIRTTITTLLCWLTLIVSEMVVDECALDALTIYCNTNFNSNCSCQHRISKNLEKLNIICSSNSKFPSDLYLFKNLFLRELSITNCSFQEVSENMIQQNFHPKTNINNPTYYQTLEKVTITNSYLMQLPSNLFCEFTNLKFLNLTNTLIEDIYSIGCGTNNTCCSSLTELYLHHNKIQELPSTALNSFGNLTALVIVSGTHFKDIQFSTFQNLSQLKIIEISEDYTYMANNDSRFIDPIVYEYYSEIFQQFWESFQWLQTTENPLTYHQCIDFFRYPISNNLHTMLKTCTFSDPDVLNYLPEVNHYLTIAQKIRETTQNSNLSGLTELYVKASINITDMMKLFEANCKSLKFLVWHKIPVTNNPLHSINTLSPLEIVIASLNQSYFHKLPVPCHNLKILVLRNSKIQLMLPKVLQHCNKLLVIDFSYNALSTLTFTFGQTFHYGTTVNMFYSNYLPQLEALILSHNKINKFDYSEIPQWLLYLDLTGNPLAKLTDLKKIAPKLKLKVLLLINLPIEDLSESTLPPSIEKLDLSQTRITIISYKYFGRLGGINLRELILANTRLVKADQQSFEELTSRKLLPVKIQMEKTKCNSDFTQYDTENCAITGPRIYNFEYHPIYVGNLSTTCFVIRKCKANVCVQLNPYLGYAVCSYCSEIDNPEMTIINTNCGNRNLQNIPNFSDSTLYDSVVLELDGNNLQTLNFGPLLSSFPKLEVLYLNMSRIATIKDPALEYSFLKELHLEDNTIRYFPKDIFENLCRLSELYLQRNELQQLKLTLCPLQGISKLLLQSNRLLEFPVLTPSNRSVKPTQKNGNFFFENIRIRELSLENNFVTLNNTKEYKSKLWVSKLYLQNNKIRGVQNDSFTFLYGLKEIHLENNNIYDLRRNAFIYQNPTKLFLQNNSLSSIPRQITRKKMKNLKELRLDNNIIYEIAVSNFKGGMNLKMINVSSNRIKIVDYRAFQILHLMESLYLDHNMIERFKITWLKDTKNMKYLYLNNNRLRGIGMSIKKDLINLELLHLHENNINRVLASSFVTFNNLTQLTLHDNLLTVIEPNAFVHLKSLRILTLHNNSFTNPQLWTFGLPSTLTNITIFNNRFECECNYVTDYLEWARKNEEITSGSTQIDCLMPNGQRKQMEAFLHEDCTAVVHILSTVVPSVGVLLFLTTVSVLLYRYRVEMQVLIYARYGIRLFNKDKTEDKVFDVFVAYSQDDIDFVAEELEPRLSDFRLCLHDRNFVGGIPIADNIVNAVESSRCTLLVLSPSFVQSQWCRMEFQLAHGRTIADHCRRLLVLVYKDVDMSTIHGELRAYLRTNTYLKWGDKRFWDKLLFSLPTSQKRPEIKHALFNPKRSGEIDSVTLIQENL